MPNKIKFLTDEAIFSLSGRNKLTTWKDTNLKVDKLMQTISGGPLDGMKFGSCFQGRCNCGDVRHGKCIHCRSEVLSPAEAWGRYGRIDLPFFYCATNKKAQLIDYIENNFKLRYEFEGEAGGKRELGNVFEWAQFGYDEATETIIITDKISDYTMTSYDGLLKVISQYHREKLGIVKSYVNSSILVAPLIMRAPYYTFEDGEKVLKNNSLTIAYICILYAIYHEIDRAFELTQYKSEAAKAGYIACIRAYINKVLDIENLIVKPNRESLPRTMQSHRIKNSGRCTIIPSPQLKIDEVEIPRHLMYECCREEFIQYMMRENDWTLETATAQYVTAALAPETQAMFTDYIDKGLDGEGKYVIINRNPTLYELGGFCCRVKLTNDYTIGVPLGICSPVGGDFDGDTFAFYAVPAHMTKIMVDAMSPRNLFRYKKNQQALFTPSHEVMGGIIVGTRIYTDNNTPILEFDDLDECKQYKKTNRNFKYQTRCIIGGKDTTLARTQFGNLFNIDLDSYIQSKVDLKKEPYITSSDIPYLYNNLSDLDDRVERIQQIQEFALLITTLSGATTPSLEEMHAELPKRFLDEIRKVQKADIDPMEKDAKVTLIYKDFLKEMNAKTDEGHYKYIDDELVRKVSDSARAKVDQLMLILSPMFNISPTKRINVGDSTMVDGLMPKDYTAMALENRITQAIKTSATPRSGYTTRQLEYLGNQFRITDEEDKFNEGIDIELSSALGRTKLDGSVITEREAKGAKAGEMVKVKSIVTSEYTKEYLVSTDCISKINKWKPGDAVGVSLFTSFTESLTQSGLSLKHGGHLFELEPFSFITAPETGHLELTDFDVIFRGDSGKEYVYPRTANFTKNYKEEDYYKKGEIFGMVYRLVTPSYRLDSIIRLIGAAPASSKKRILNNEVIVTDCYAFEDGKMHYNRDRDGRVISIQIGKHAYQYSPASCYPYPEGAEIKKGQRICTGVLDLRSAVAHYKSYVEPFQLFYKQCNELIKGTVPEMIEFVYALIVVKTEYGIEVKNVIQSVKEGPGTLNVLAFREPKALFKKIDYQGIDFVPDPISEIVLPTLFLSNGI